MLQQPTIIESHGNKYLVFTTFDGTIPNHYPSLSFYSFSQGRISAKIPYAELYAESFDQDNSDKTIVYYIEEESLIKVELNLSQQ